MIANVTTNAHPDRWTLQIMNCDQWHGMNKIREILASMERIAAGKTTLLQVHPIA